MCWWMSEGGGLEGEEDRRGVGESDESNSQVNNSSSLTATVIWKKPSIYKFDLTITALFGKQRRGGRTIHEQPYVVYDCSKTNRVWWLTSYLCRHQSKRQSHHPHHICRWMSDGGGWGDGWGRNISQIIPIHHLRRRPWYERSHLYIKLTWLLLRCLDIRRRAKEKWATICCLRPQ